MVDTSNVADEHGADPDRLQVERAPADQRSSRRYAFACARCKNRKIRCDGEHPSCRRCIRSDQICRYPQSSAYTEERLKDAHARIGQLEEALADVRNDNLIDQENPSSEGQMAPTVLRQEPGVPTLSPDEEAISPHVGLDESGHVTYYGPTSRFHASSLTDPSPASTAALRTRLYQVHAPALESNIETLRQVWQPLLQMKTEDELGMSPKLAKDLLDIYWIWQYPLHNCLYKPCFIMDMALGGPYFSKFLLHCICALAARHLQAEHPTFGDLAKGENFVISARSLLLTALADTKPAIPTIQGLLILAGRQCAVGQSSEGWLYTGMAIRMMTDLGLHLDLHRLAELEKFAPADLELRKRLYCSAYAWDKTLSLSLGRPPSLTRLSSTAMDLFDCRDDQELWQPAEFLHYPVTCGWNTTCFQAFCRLGQIIETILVNSPGCSNSASAARRVVVLQDKLQQWYEQLPDVLRMERYNEICPPPHIFSLNLLYFTLKVILWRPYRNVRQDLELNQRARKACAETSHRIHQMILLYSKTFKLSRMTYLISYCVYSAATVDVEELASPVQLNQGAVATRLGLSLRILEDEARQTPGVRRSIDIIRRQLRTWTPKPVYLPSDSLTPQQRNTTREEMFNRSPATETGDPTTSYQTQAPTTLQGRAEGEWIEFWDTGAGFLPDAFPWSFENTLSQDELTIALL